MIGSFRLIRFMGALKDERAENSVSSERGCEDRVCRALQYKSEVGAAK